MMVYLPDGCARSPQRRGRQILNHVSHTSRNSSENHDPLGHIAVAPEKRLQSNPKRHVVQACSSPFILSAVRSTQPTPFSRSYSRGVAVEPWNSGAMQNAMPPSSSSGPRHAHAALCLATTRPTSPGRCRHCPSGPAMALSRDIKRKKQGDGLGPDKASASPRLLRPSTTDVGAPRPHVHWRLRGRVHEVRMGRLKASAKGRRRRARTQPSGRSRAPSPPRPYQAAGDGYSLCMQRGQEICGLGGLGAVF
ncbi:hypothetical protein BS50DRAFT_145737 [Corynespora cassiicola Philippines]|uniref:Uncharacterized protein n=1 Tax=Corynespora cassiicola Philippines TaxID=1448308 RepID=A0A2T2N8J4_CORCC|nr:hypothetical protein BS50DRAFT_145737 [Corynespora cassiicola Philippines]